MGITKEVAVVAGGGRGIGRAIALHLASEHFHVVISGTNWDEMGRVEQEILHSGGECESIPCDPTDPTSIANFSKKISEKFPQIDLLAHCHSHLVPGPLSEIPLDEWNRSIQTNLTAPFAINQMALSHMRPRAHIFHIASITGDHPIPNWGALCASKAGLIAYVNVFREEIRPRGIRVTTIIPGIPHTPVYDEAPGEWKATQTTCPDSIARTILGTYRQTGNMVAEQIILT
jgi:NAD(P)-dependent dehydrogenase (short-subunit alcohol dehydrogenase family)